VGYRQHVDGVLKSADHSSQGFGLIYIDVDEFKAVNDTYGHYAGDELIRKVAHRLEATARATDGVARLGGDEFAIVLSEVTSNDQLSAAERRVQDAFKEPFTLGDVDLCIGVSVGGGVWLEHGRTIDELARHADEEMYAAKASSRRCPVET
jgi:diguanylate cyclase (GGDEF)-like protein